MSLLLPDSGLLIWMIIIFAIMFTILAKFGFPVITRMIDKRNAHIEASLLEAQQAHDALAALAEEQQKLIAEARAEQGRILKEAAATRDDIVEQAKARAGEEAEKIIAHARMEIAAERESALSEIRSQVALMSLEVAGKVMRKQLSDDAEQAALVDRFFEEASNAKIN